MRKYPHYGTANDNSFIGDIVRAIDQHEHLKPFEKDLLVNRITERYTGGSVEVKIAHLAMGSARPEMFVGMSQRPRVSKQRQDDANGLHG